MKYIRVRVKSSFSVIFHVVFCVQLLGLIWFSKEPVHANSHSAQTDLGIQIATIQCHFGFHSSSVVAFFFHVAGINVVNM